eukprot:TRINITY_DN7736_c0_g1_i2.p1 TRINITY_DN7736_c0_g1~~TRINITY_DN7736_c0_g1_i2.p1  ORF type:complete len:528 (-),score=190.91 TRINITY_DN7736_c0_g1_i2:55-1638(-)
MCIRDRSLLSSLCLAEGDIVALTDENFESFVRENAVVLVNFFAPWCSHCKLFESEYKKLVQLVKDEPYKLAELDTTVHKNITKRALISSFPTVKLYFNNSTFTYFGERTAHDLLAFIRKKTNPPLVELNTTEEVAQVKNGKGRRCIFAVDANMSLSTYRMIAKRVNEFRFYSGNVEVVKEVFGEVEKGNVVLLGEETKVYKGAMTSYDFENFLEANKFPIVPELNSKIIDSIFTPKGKKGIILFYDVEDEKLVEELKKAATKLNSSDYIFAKASIHSDWGHHIADSFALDRSSLPFLEAVEFADEILRYRHSEALTSEAIEAFVARWKDKKLERLLSSEAEPLENPGPVYRAVGRTFKKLVVENEDDVLVKFTAGWCSQCLIVDPIFKNLSESLSKNAKLKFVEIDGIKNDVEGYKIQAFPMLKMFPGKNKTQVSTYDGEYREADITKFIKLKASHPVDIPEETPKEEDILKEVENILKQSEEKVKEDDEKDHDDDKKEDKKENDSDSDGEDNEKNTKKGAGAGGDL